MGPSPEVERKMSGKKGLVDHVEIIKTQKKKKASAIWGNGKMGKKSATGALRAGGDKHPSRSRRTVKTGQKKKNSVPDKKLVLAL